MLIKSKKGDISVTLLVILTITLCGFALISFYLADDSIDEVIEDYNILESVYLNQSNLVFMGGDKESLEDNGYSTSLILRTKILEYVIKYYP